MIGNTLSEIAENKAGIIKPGCIVVSAPQKQEVREILEQKARQFGCPIIYAEPEKAVVLEEDYRGMRFSYKDSENISIRLSGNTGRSEIHVNLPNHSVSKKPVSTALFSSFFSSPGTCTASHAVTAFMS